MMIHNGEDRVGGGAHINSMLKLYELLRDEILHSIELQHKIMMALGTVIAFVLGISFIEESWRLLVIMLPFLSAIFIGLWLIEVTRMMRAGGFLHLLEIDINRKFGDICIGWETFLRTYGNKEKRRNKVRVYDAHKIHRTTTQMLIIIIFLSVAASMTPFILMFLTEVSPFVIDAFIAVVLAIPLFLLGFLSFQAYHAVRHEELVSIEEYDNWKKDVCSRYKIGNK
mgnify:CR=1 FL=1